MNLGRKPALAKDPQSEERGLKEECEKSLESQRCAEDIANVAGVLRPVHAELELLNDSRGYSEGKVNEEYFAEEIGDSLPLGIPCLASLGLHDGHKGGESDGQRHLQEVVDRCDAELPPGQLKGV